MGDRVTVLFTDRTVSFDGRFYKVRDARCQPAPIQKPWPPIWVGGGGERRTLRIVARHADAWNIPAVPPEAYSHKLSVLAEHCQATGRDCGEIEKTMETCALVIDGVIAKRRSWEAKLARWLNGRRKDSGEPELTQREAINRIRDTYVVGSADECRAKLAAYVEVGVQHFTPYFLDYPDDATLESLPGLLSQPASNLAGSPSPTPGMRRAGTGIYWRVGRSCASDLWRPTGRVVNPDVCSHRPNRGHALGRHLRFKPFNPPDTRFE
ncbi:MAG: LLM class flavin-dependent oxidoreductase [Verrucomicrobia bacterium]|nr:LLM class flavin-dependent oxidoreductase [Verrucomicrobiota bacterium]